MIYQSVYNFHRLELIIYSNMKFVFVSTVRFLQLIVTAVYPANRKYLYNICTTAAQRGKRWAVGIQMLYKYFVFTGSDSM